MESELSIFILYHEFGFYDANNKRKTLFIADSYDEAYKYFFEEVNFRIEEEHDGEFMPISFLLSELWELRRRESFSSLSEEEKRTVAEEWFESHSNNWTVHRCPVDNRCIQKRIEPLKEKISSLENRIRLYAFKSSEAMKEIPIPDEIVENLIGIYL